MMTFWNYLKKVNHPDDMRHDEQPIDSEETMSLEEWMSQQNPWLARENWGNSIPNKQLKWKFHYFDIDKSGDLKFEEIWIRIQEDDIQAKEYYRMYA